MDRKPDAVSADAGYLSEARATEAERPIGCLGMRNWTERKAVQPVY